MKMASNALTSVKPDAKTSQELKEQEDVEFQIPQRFTKSGRKRATPFPMKLMQVLSMKKYSHIITWTPDGKSFTILRPNVFASEILPKFFKDSKYASFTRKLHRWGFQRHLRGSETGSFFNKNFQMGRPDLLDKMTCYKRPPESHHISSPTAHTFASMPHPDALMFPAILMNQAQQPMMPSAEMIAQAQEFRWRQQQLMMQQVQAQQQILAQQQMQQAHQTSRGSENMSMPGMGGLSNDDRFNGAIELEVARRLQDRVQATSFSQQALAMMQQQQQQQQHQQQPYKQQPQEPPYHGGMHAAVHPYFDPNSDETRGA